jgi:hypothetical protein
VDAVRNVTLERNDMRLRQIISTFLWASKIPEEKKVTRHGVRYDNPNDMTFIDRSDVLYNRVKESNDKRTMRLRQTRVKLRCDNCAKETGYEIIVPDEPRILTISKEWILGYDITGGGSIYDSSNAKDYCGITCLHEAIDKHHTVPEMVTQHGATTVGCMIVN